MYEIRDTENGKGLFFNGVFCGSYSETFGIHQFSGNDNQIFDVQICVNYLLTLIKENETVYSHISIAGHQLHLQVNKKPFIVTQGEIIEHSK